MAFRQGLFDSTTFTEVSGVMVGDKAEASDFFAEYNKESHPDGVPYSPSSNLLVVAKTGMTIEVKAGKLYKDGYMAWETAAREITFTTSGSEQTFYISGRLDAATQIFTGSKIDKYTTFVADTDVCVAKVVIPASSVVVTDAMITDLRANKTYCGYCDEIFQQGDALLQDLRDAITATIGGGLPNHASTHEIGGDDAIPLTSIATVGVDYVAPASIAMLNGGGVFSGGSVTAQGTPDQTVAVSAGSVITPEGKRYAFNAVSALAATAANATNPRIDIVYVSSAGVVTYLAGTAAASPSQPATPSNGTILAKLTRAANDNTIATSDLEDQRDFITTANDFEDTNLVTESSNTFACDIARKHTKNFYFTITNTTGKTVVFSNKPYGTCDVILTIKSTATAAVTWTLDGITLVWPAGAPTLTSGYTYDILFSYVPVLGKWVGRAQLGAAN